jgi:hypothetical protein
MGRSTPEKAGYQILQHKSCNSLTANECGAIGKGVPDSNFRKHSSVRILTELEEHKLTGLQPSRTGSSRKLSPRPWIAAPGELTFRNCQGVRRTVRFPTVERRRKRHVEA